MATLYLTEQGSTLHKESKRFVIEKDGQVVLEVPDFKIDRVIIYGNVQLTTQAMAHLLENGIETSFLSMYGKFRGRLAPVESKNVYLRIAQYKKSLDEEFKLNTAKKIVAAKIENQRRLIQRYARNHPEVDFGKPVSDLEALITTLANRTQVSTVMGVEGQATAVYFETYGKMFRGELRFETRSRRPPRDPVNGLLSFGYVLITNEIFSILSAMGFDPYIGFLHGIEYGRPSLALDMVEEFRHVISDMLTLDLINRKILKLSDFEEREDGGVYLKQESQKAYFRQYESKMLQKFQDVNRQSVVTYRDLFKQQAHSMANFLQDRGEYRPFLVR